MTKRDKQWNTTRWVELLYVLGVVVALLYGARRTSDTGLLLGGSAFLVVLGQLIWIWQYRVLDELGKLRFLKSFTVLGMTLGNGLGLLLMWSFVRALQSPGSSGLPDLPGEAAYLVLLVSLSAAGLTNLYLRWREGR